MPTRALFLVFICFICACSSPHRYAKYAVTVYFTSWDSSRSRAEDCPEKLGKRLLYSYEEYNADSNRVYAEYYTVNDPRHDDCTGGSLTKPAEIVQTEWSGRKKIAEKWDMIQGLNNHHPTYVHQKYHFQYRDSLLLKWLDGDNPVESYAYNARGQLSEMDKYSKNDPWSKILYFYNDAGKKIAEKQYFNHRYYSRDTLLYNQNNQLVRRERFDTSGRMIGDRQIFWDPAGRCAVEKGNEDADWAGWDEETRYHYNGKAYAGQDYYVEGKLKVKFEAITGPPRK